MTATVLKLYTEQGSEGVEKFDHFIRLLEPRLEEAKDGMHI